MISLLLCAICCICFVLWRGRKDSGAPKLPPKYSGQLPFIGHAHLFLGDGTRLWRRIKSLTADCIKNGGVIHMYLGSKLYYVISDPDDILKVSNMCLEKHYLYEFSKPWLGNGLGTAPVEIWKRHRRLLNPAFGLPVVHSFLDVFNSQSRKMVEDIAAHVDKGKFDQNMYMKKLTFETFCLTACGIDSFKNQTLTEKYIEALDGMLDYIVRRFQRVWLHSDLMFRLSGWKRRLDNGVKTFNAISDEVIQRKETMLDNGAISANSSRGTRYKPVLDLMLELSAEDAFTDKEIREQLAVMIAGGTDTSACLLTCLLALVGSHPEVQEMMYEEIIEVLGTDRDVMKEDLQKLVYTEAVLKETLRFLPTVPLVLREVDKNVQIKNYTLRAGSQCVLLLVGALWDPSWGADVEQFKPERWLDPASLPANLSNAFAAFSLGKRNCIGKTYALTSLKVTLAHFFRTYRVTSDLTDIQLKMDFVLKPVTGHEVRLERRR